MSDPDRGGDVEGVLVDVSAERRIGWPVLVVILAVVFGVGLLGAVATASSVRTWYMTLEKPWWTPPNWLFGPMWSTLYVLMSVALWQVMREGLERSDVRFASWWFGGHLVLNGLWSPLFFSWKWMVVALVEIVLLWLSILIMIVLFGRIRRSAGWLLVPYLGWVSVATALNLSLVWRNVWS